QALADRVPVPLPRWRVGCGCFLHADLPVNLLEGEAALDPLRGAGEATGNASVPGGFLSPGLCGGSASGKTTVANKIIEALDVPWVVLLSMDCFYKVLNKEQQELAAHNEYNFDHPDAFDFDLLISVLRKLKKGKSVKVPVYDFTTHSRRKDWVCGGRAGS
uniref:Phosphoribulokinase/uridine kinase domain-containing protein n=2 Tax=Terrapene triunguis TaxID=2587831 RepID=A0A674JB65_9SAUR